MDEYIEREALERIFEERYLYYRSRSQRELFPGYIQVDDGLTISAMIMESCLDSLREAPAADVALVRHGRWIKNGVFWRCSRCGILHHERVEPQWWNYCPTCGAKMEGCNNNDKGGNGNAQD